MLPTVADFEKQEWESSHACTWVRRQCPWFVQEELQVVPRLLAMLDSPVATLRAKALVSFALLTQTHLALLLHAFHGKLSPQVLCYALEIRS